MANVGGGGAKPSASSLQSESVQQKKDLASWWRNFKRSDKKVGEPEQQVTQSIFGVPLQQSINNANVAISLLDDRGESYIYGYVPIVVAKCGVFLKEKATDVEGIFRLAGSEKRIKELRTAFDSPDRYGKGLDWTGYTVHDAANILRRYFNQLPEPIVPLEFYEQFREPLRNHQAQAVGYIESQSPSIGDFDIGAAIRSYQRLITEMPPLNRQLLLYILDLLAVFASKSDLNKMTTQNLAAIFQPGLLSHPQHDMAPREYRLSQDVLIFLIENQDSFLIGMQGTAADAATVRDVQSGTPVTQPSTPTTPGRSKTVLGRSSSNASAGAESVRKWGNVRRNVSVSSKHSKLSDTAMSAATTPTGVGVYRSNTMPSRRGNASHSPRFSRERPSASAALVSDAAIPAAAVAAPASDPAAATGTDPVSAQAVASQLGTETATPQLVSSPGAPLQHAPSSRAPPPQQLVGASVAQTLPSGESAAETAESSVAPQGYATPKRDAVPLVVPPGSGSEHIDNPAASAVSPGRGLLDIFKQSPTSDGEGRKPKKLQKKRAIGSSLSSAHSSSQSLHHVISHEAPQLSPASPSFPPVSPSHAPHSPSILPVAPVTSDLQRGRLPHDQPQHQHQHQHQQLSVSTYATAQFTPMRSPSEHFNAVTSLRPATSPTQSYRSADLSDADMAGDDLPLNALEQPGKAKTRHMWRFSKSPSRATPPQSQTPGISNSAKEHTHSKSAHVGMGTWHGPRLSFQEPSSYAYASTDTGIGTPKQQTSMSSTDHVFSDSERERRGPMSWLRGKLQERRDKEAEKRAKTPERPRDRERAQSKQDLRLPAEAIPVRGKSLENQSTKAVERPLASPTQPVAPPTSVQAQGDGSANGNTLT